ncbi:MAG: hypothetical protein WAT79_17485 [Saprospiraceae bacterium]
MKFFYLPFFAVFVMLTCGQKMYAQKLLQIEDPKEVETIRYYEGQKITFRSKESQDEWQTKKIKTIMVEESVIIFSDGFMHISEISHIRHPLPLRQIAGKLLMSFGGAWLVYGGIALAVGLPNVVAKDLMIGLVPLVGGWVIQKFAYHTYEIGKNGRIRLLDISFPGMPSP